AEFQPAPIARRVSEPQVRRASEPVVAEQLRDKTIDHSDKVVPLVTGTSTARTTSVRLQKMLNTNGQGHGNGSAPVIDIATRTAPSLPRIEMPTPSTETVPSVGAVRTEAPARPVETPRIDVPMLEIQLSQSETETTQGEPVELAQDVVEAARADEAPS